MALPEIITTAPQAQNPVFQDILNWRGSLGIYDPLMGGFTPDLNNIDFGLTDFVFDPEAPQSPEQQILAYIDDFSKAIRGMVEVGRMTPAEAAAAIQGAWNAVGATDPNGNPVVVDPNSINAADPRYGVQYAEGGQIRLPQYDTSEQGGGASATDAIGALMGVFTGVFAGGGIDGGSSGPSTPTAPMTPDTEHPWIFDGEKLTNVFTGEVITEGDFSNLEAGQRYSYAAPDTTIKTPDVTIPPIIPVPNPSTPTTPTTPTTPVVPTPTPTEVIPPVPPTPTPPTTPPAGFEGETGAEVAPPVIVPPAPPQEVIPAPPVVAPPPLQQPGFEGETGAETAPGTTTPTTPDTRPPGSGDTGGTGDTGSEGDGTGDGTGDGDGDGNGDGIGIDLGGLFSSVSPTPIVDDIFAIEKFKLTRPSLDITNTLFGGFRR